MRRNLPFVREVLSQSKEGVPHPADWDGSFQVFLKEVRVKSWSKFAKTPLSCTIDLEPDRLEFLPWRNAGSKPNYALVPNTDRKITVSVDAFDEGLGLILEKAFEAYDRQRKEFLHHLAGT